MLIRKKSGDAEGWAIGVALKTCVVFDELGNPNGVVEGNEYYVQGDCDPAIVSVGSKPLTSEVYDIGEVEEEVE